MLDKRGFGRSTKGTGKYKTRKIPRTTMTRNQIRSIFLSAFLLVAAPFATRPRSRTGRPTTISSDAPGRAVSNGSRCRNCPRPQRCSRRHLPRRLSHRPDSARVRNRGRRQERLGVLGGTRMDGHVRPPGVLEPKNSRRGLSQPTRRPLRPAVCLQARRVVTGWPFQDRGHRGN